MSENALTTLDFGQVQTRKTNLQKFSGGGAGFLRRLQVNDNNKYTKKGLIAPGNIGVPISDDEIIDLGKSVDLLLLAVREKVLDMNMDKPLAVYEPAHEEFSRIFWEVYDRDKYEEAGGEFDVNDLPVTEGIKLVTYKGLNGYMHGAEFLVFERSTGKLYHLYLSNASGREEAKRMEVFLPVDAATAEATGVEQRGPLPCTLQGKFIPGKKHQWWAPEVLKCSETFDNLPPGQTLLAEIQKFVTVDIEGGEDEGEEAGEGDRAR